MNESIRFDLTDEDLSDEALDRGTMERICAIPTCYVCN